MTQQVFKRLTRFFMPTQGMQLMRCVAAALMLLSLTALQAHEYYADGFMIIHPWSDPTQPGQVDAPVYFGLDSVTQGDKLIKAFSPLAERVEFRAGDDSSSPVLSELPFGTGDANAFGPGKPHLLLRGLKVPFEDGRSYLLMLEFKRAGKIVVGISVGAH